MQDGKRLGWPLAGISAVYFLDVILHALYDFFLVPSFIVSPWHIPPRPAQTAPEQDDTKEKKQEDHSLCMHPRLHTKPKSWNVGIFIEK
eukprot:1161625-Pelagomonas_calceolata.AAC.12